MMISITIGLMIVAALVGVVASNSRSTKTNDRTSELQSNGRYAMDHLKRELRHAGYRGYTWAEPSTPGTLPAVANECRDDLTTAAGAFAANIRQGIWGANNSNPYTGTGNCLSDGRYLRGDVLVIRRAAGAPATALNTGTVYFHSTYSAGEVFQGTEGVSGVSEKPAANFELQEYVYYIGKGGDNGTDTTVPALRRIALKRNGDNCNGAAVDTATMCDEMVVSGIEQMQIQYGRATTDLNTRYYSAITGASTDAARTDWDDVNSVRIWLLARNTRQEAGYANTNTYAMGDANYAVGDSFRRQLFTSVVQLRN